MPDDTKIPPTFVEWFLGKVGDGKFVSIDYKGEDGIGPREIGKLIKLFEAQQSVLDEEADDA